MSLKGDIYTTSTRWKFYKSALVLLQRQQDFQLESDLGHQLLCRTIVVGNFALKCSYLSKETRSNKRKFIRGCIWQPSITCVIVCWPAGLARKIAGNGTFLWIICWKPNSFSILFTLFWYFVPLLCLSRQHCSCPCSSLLY